LHIIEVSSKPFLRVAYAVVWQVRILLASEIDQVELDLETVDAEGREA